VAARQAQPAAAGRLLGGIGEIEPQGLLPLWCKASEVIVPMPTNLLEWLRRPWRPCDVDYVPGLNLLDALRRFVDSLPEFRGRWAEHGLQDNGDPLPYSFLDDVTYDFVASAQVAYKSDIERFAEAIEALASSADEEVVNLVWISFFEYVVGHPDTAVRRAFERLRPFLGPASLKIIGELEGR
jgi:hypothetical protein